VFACFTLPTPCHADASPCLALPMLRLALPYHALAERSAKSIGKRLSALWPHIEAQFDAEKTQVRGGTWRYDIHPKNRFAGLQV
jgi:hypothetical protein